MYRSNFNKQKDRPLLANSDLMGAYFKSACYATQISFGDNPSRWIVTMHVAVQPCEFKKFKIVRHWQPGRRCVRRGAALFAKPEHLQQDTNPDGMGICGTIHIQSVF